MKNVLSGLLLVCTIMFGSEYGSAKEMNMIFERDGQQIVKEIDKKFESYKRRGYQLAPEAFPMLMASWLFNTSEIDAKTMTLTWQHDTKFFESIGVFVNKHICQTKVGEQLCRIYFKKVNSQAKALDSSDIAGTLAKHMILAVSEDPKTLDSWSSNYIMWLFVNPKSLNPEHLTRMIVHEMFQAIDIKNALAGLLVAAKDFPDSKLCGLVGGTLNKAVRFASSSVRSYKVEDAIVGDILNRNHESLSRLSSNSCLNNLKWAHKQLEIFYAKLGKSAFIHQMYKVPDQCFDAALRDSIEDKDSFSYGVNQFGQNVDQCEFLSEPDLNQIETLDLDLDILDTWFHGPRPRVGGI